MTTKEKEETTMVRGVPWALWLSSGLVIALLLFSTVMLMVTMYLGLACSKPTDSASQYQPLVRPRTTAVTEEPTESSTDEEVQQKINELFKRKGYSNPDPDPEDQLEESGSQIVDRSDRPRVRRTRRPRPLQKIGKDFDASQSYVIKHANGTITYVFPENVLAGNSDTKTQTVANYNNEDTKPEEDTVKFRTPSSNSSDIVFPIDPEPLPGKTPGRKEPCSPDQPICSKLEDYPHEKINDLIAKYKQEYAGVFGEDVVVPEGDALVTRFDTDSDLPLCEPYQRLIHPQKGFNKDNMNITIVNTEDYKQGVRVETCRNTGKPCNEIGDYFGMRRTECKQMYHYRTLLAIHPVTGKPYKESFKLPSCCKCVIKPLVVGST